jgi:hypothetical protein
VNSSWEKQNNKVKWKISLPNSAERTIQFSSEYEVVSQEIVESDSSVHLYFEIKLHTNTSEQKGFEEMLLGQI